MYTWRRMQVYETAGAAWFSSHEYPEQIIIADGCLDSQVEDSWLFS